MRIQQKASVSCSLNTRTNGNMFRVNFNISYFKIQHNNDQKSNFLNRKVYVMCRDKIIRFQILSLIFFYINLIKGKSQIRIIKLTWNFMSIQHLPKGFVNPEGLLQLKQYKYKSGQYTWLDNKVNPFWQWVVTLVPEWVAPNLITFIGWLFIIASYANMLIYDYTFKKNIPSYCFFFAAFCLFAYSTLDAIDGKQARRTKSSSPLGQLFDHGCDSFSITFVVLAICQAAKLQTTEVFIVFTACQAVFWTSNWMEYNTGVLQTNVGQFGVTETQYLCAVIHIVTGIFGQDFWQINLSSFMPRFINASFPVLNSIKIGSLIAIGMGMIIFLIVIYSVFHTVYETKKLRPLGQFFTLAIILVIQFVWLYLDVYQQYDGIILVNFGIVQSLIICKLIISSVTKMKLQFFHSEIIPTIIATIIMIGLDLRHNIKGQIIVFWVLFAVNLAMTFRFLYTTIGQITKFLGIYCFSLKKNQQLEDKKQ